MSWRDLLQKSGETQILPWTGGRSLRLGVRAWKLTGRLPSEFGWYEFVLQGREAHLKGPADPQPELLINKVKGYLVGDRILVDGVRVNPDDIFDTMGKAEPVRLIEPGLDRFCRITAGRHFEEGPLVYEGQAMPLGPEDAVMAAYLGQKSSVEHISGVPPALDAAFRMEMYQTIEAARRRAELEEQRRKEELRLKIQETLGTGESRRALAHFDFEQGARAALLVGGAQYLDHRPSVRKNEMVVKFMLDHQRFECVCDANTLRILDAGICLTDHHTGEKGDTFFTLESLPGVIRQAQHEGVLHVFRHVDEYHDNDYD